MDIWVGFLSLSRNAIDSARFDSSPTRGTRTRPNNELRVFVRDLRRAYIIAANYRAHAATHARALSRLIGRSVITAIVMGRSFREFAVTKRPSSSVSLRG